MSEGVVAQLHKIFEDAQTSPCSFSQTLKILEQKVLKVVGVQRQRLQDLWENRPGPIHTTKEFDDFIEELEKIIGVGGAEP